MKQSILNILAICSLGLILNACNPAKAVTTTRDSERMIVLHSAKRYTTETIYTKEVTIYPESFLETIGNGKLIFTRKVNIIGESQVFATNINIEFGDGAISTLNPAWFGAKGYDEFDDTKAFQKTFQVAKDYNNSVNVEIPIGKFRISETLEVGNSLPSRKSINLIGQSMSIGSAEGSVLSWNGAPGGTLLRLSNYCAGQIENLDFSAPSSQLLKFNVELLPTDYQVNFENCSFSGSAGAGSANVNINNGNNLQVSEIYFQNCIFRSQTEDSRNWKTESAVIGGNGNTKNFSFERCSFLGYSKAAININVSDIVRIESCTFANNEIDIVCMLCNTMMSGNYSEHSKSFFKTTISTNISFTTMMNNCFYGTRDADYVIREGAGKLLLINNNFGGMGGDDLANQIRWEHRISSSIYSIGNFYRNKPGSQTPFYNKLNEEGMKGINSFGDIIGTDELNLKEIIIQKQQ